MERFETSLAARVLRHDERYGLSTLLFADGELRVPRTPLEVGSAVLVRIAARDVSVALTRPMDVSITNRLPGAVVELRPLELPYCLVGLDLGATRILALVTMESVERLGLEPGLRAWAMIKSVALDPDRVSVADPPVPRPWPQPRR
jgi:molybdate transport system ATP-binding protein